MCIYVLVRNAHLRPHLRHFPFSFCDFFTPHFPWAVILAIRTIKKTQFKFLRRVSHGSQSPLRPLEPARCGGVCKQIHCHICVYKCVFLCTCVSFLLCQLNQPLLYTLQFTPTLLSLKCQLEHAIIKIWTRIIKIDGGWGSSTLQPS